MTTTTENALFDQKSAGGRAGDKIFSGTALAAGIAILAILAFVALYLIINAMPAITAGEGELANGKTSFWGYVGPMMVGTLIASAIALAIATPVAIGVALFISHFAPERLSQSIGYVIDLLAAIPSVVYGAWGMTFLGPALVPVYRWLSENASWIPLFAGGYTQTGRTLFTASVVLAVMILPIITSVSREVFLQTPRLHEEAALALGATNWEMIRTAVLPFGAPGVVGGTMLGLGRALGETMAVAIILAPGAFTWNLIGSGNVTIPAEIALNFPEAFGMRQNELIAAGLVLFVITLVVNMIARWIVSRHKEFSGAN